MKTTIIAFYTSVLLLIAGCVASDSREATMSENYDGDPTNYPTHVRLVQDGEPASQAFLALADQDLADRTAFLHALIATVTGAPVIYVAAGPTTWTAGPNDTRVELRGWGGGGGGGGGANGIASFTDRFPYGGGGGGAPLEASVIIDVVPGTVYEILCGAGGNGGAAGADGSDGGDTIFRVQGGATLATFKGAKGGKGGSFTSATTDFTLSLGGAPIVQYRPNLTAALTAVQFQQATYCYGPGYGGEGCGAHAGETSRVGAASVNGSPGGAAGAPGAASGSYWGGGGGGGGAAGPGGGGLPGRDGGAGNNAGAGGAAPFAGAGGAPGSGAGGGGGGAGGCGSTAGGAATSGYNGVGGSAILRVVG